jgi:hypothetical protein
MPPRHELQKAERASLAQFKPIRTPPIATLLASSVSSEMNFRFGLRWFSSKLRVKRETHWRTYAVLSYRNGRPGESAATARLIELASIP